MAWAEQELLRGLGRAWIEECESASRAASDLLSGLVSAMPGAAWPVTLHWERTGSGPPVLLIMGLGLSGGAWWRTVPVLARRLEVITFDNRGVGNSQALLHAYSTAAMADDAVSVLDAAGVDRVHVYGISLGGMVAQQLALRHPERVRSLVLGATHAGGRHARRPDFDVVTFLRRRLWMRHEEAAWSSVEFNYGERCRSRASGANRRRRQTAARAFVSRAGLPGSAVGRGAARLLPATEPDRHPDARRARQRRPHDPSRERAHDRGAESRVRASSS